MKPLLKDVEKFKVEAGFVQEISHIASRVDLYPPPPRSEVFMHAFHTSLFCAGVFDGGFAKAHCTNCIVYTCGFSP